MKAAFFATWGTVDVPIYTKYFIDQVAKFHDKVYVISNDDRPVDRTWFDERGYELHMFPNTGRDFQKYHDLLMLKGRDWTTELDSLLLINDSVICYGPLDVFFTWVRQQGHDMVGLNGMKFPLHHCQGSPITFNKKFLPIVWDHFQKTGVVKPLQEIHSYELAFPELSDSLISMFPQMKRRGWDELFSVPFEDGVPLVKHYCIAPRKPFLLKQWQRRINTFAHPDCRPWALLPIPLDPSYVFRSKA